MNKIKAFTLLELVIAIVTIGILASIAIPKVTNITGSASKSTVLADTNSLQSSILMAYGQGQVKKSKIIEFDGKKLTLNKEGYPYKLEDSLGNVNEKNCTDVFELLLNFSDENKYETTVEGNVCYFSYEGASIEYDPVRGDVNYKL